MTVQSHVFMLWLHLFMVTRHMLLRMILDSTRNILDESPHTMQMTIYFAICHFSCPDLVFKACPRQPPDGFIMNGLAMMIISVIFGLLTLRAWVPMLQFSNRWFIQQLILRELHIYHMKHQWLDWYKQAETSLTNKKCPWQQVMGNLLRQPQISLWLIPLASMAPANARGTWQSATRR